MPRRRSATLRGVSKHRSYTIAEAARALGVTRGTVTRWLKDGLPAITDRKPHLILGEELIAYRVRRKPAKATCRLEECYCLRCRAPRVPAGGMTDLIVYGKTGNLAALCGTCLNPMHKRLSLKRLDDLRNILDVVIRQATARIFA
jgi:excisionase family DNA binding protein